MISSLAPFTCNVPVAKDKPTFSVALSCASFVTLPAKFNVALPDTILFKFLIASSTYFLFAASPSACASATLVIFIPPALMPSLPIVTVLVAPSFVLAIDTPSAPNVTLEPVVPSPLLIEVMFFKSLASFTFNVSAAVPSFFTVILF